MVHNLHYIEYCTVNVEHDYLDTYIIGYSATEFDNLR